MGKKMFVGGLPYEVTESQLKTLFAVCGTVVSAKVIMDRETGRSKGFGFVEMSTDAEAAAAIAKLNNSQVGERRMFVNEARPMEPRAPGAPRPGGPGGPGPRPSFDKPAFGGFSDKPSFGPDKKGFHERKKKYEERKNNFDGGGKGGKPGKGFGEKKGGRKGRGDFDDDDGF